MFGCVTKLWNCQKQYGNCVDGLGNQGLWFIFWLYDFSLCTWFEYRTSHVNIFQQFQLLFFIIQVFSFFKCENFFLLMANTYQLPWNLWQVLNCCFDGVLHRKLIDLEIDPMLNYSAKTRTLKLGFCVFCYCWICLDNPLLFMHGCFFYGSV